MTFALFFVSAALLSLLITPAAIKLNLLDRPNYRKIHERPIPKGGGIGIFIPAIILELIYFLFNGAAIPDAFKYFTILFVTLALLIEGITDDKLELGAKEKLFVQVFAAALTLLSGIRFHTFDLLIPDLLLTLVWITGVINAVNLIDGLDGLAAGVAAISCIGFGVIGYVYGEKTVALLALILIGGCLGFLKYNFRPARIFMGDTGSVPLGYNLAILGILCENTAKGEASILIPVIMLGIPLFDTLLTVVRRAVKHKPIFQPDRSHFYNLMMDLKGIEHKKTVLILYAINVMFAALAAVLAFLDDLWRVAAVCTIIAAAGFFSIWMGFIKTDE